ncbi:hypothetical protein AGMMS49543_28270 [Betaproteobacteria bacterium]|nr:hypothetical protein AGMMS49543_28270 [Betaproteobacteria bacterium]
MVTIELTLEPVDNLKLARLCGALDENLRQIENGLNITINRRGALFTLSGLPARVRQGESALRHFYAQSGEELAREDIQLGLVEISRNGDSERGAAPVLVTRRAELHGRTPRQVEYLHNIQNHDITFGIGPAGTGKTYLAVASAVDASSEERPVGKEW